MKYNKNNGTIDLVPMTLNVVNLEALKLICRKTSERYEKNLSKQKNQRKDMNEMDIKKRDIRSNKIYFKRRKERDDQIYFSDYKIKYGSDIAHHRTQDYSNVNAEESFNSQKEYYKEPLILNGVHQCQTIINKGKTVQSGIQHLKLKHLKNDEQHLEGSIEAKRKGQTKMQKRKSPLMIKMSFSYKNYRNIQQSDTTNQNQNRNIFAKEMQQKIDGWAIQSPLIYDIDKKMDITQYTRPDPEESKQFLSERKKPKDKYSYLSKIRQIKN